MWDVWLHELEGTISINGEVHELVIFPSTVPGENATFSQTVTLTEQVNRINVSVKNPTAYIADGRLGVREASENESGSAGGPPGDGPPGEGPPGEGPPDDDPDDGEPGVVQIGYDVLKLDGDGLPDWYETAVLGTDPLDPDSNSVFTERDESNVGIIDGAKDFSGDGLTAYQEYKLGTNPLVKDTTGDGLEDGFQVMLAGTDPLVNDTSGDGIPDANTDLSGDGLTLIEEQAHGTNPLLQDTDRDGLTDYEEIHVYGTDPLNPDTSGSGLTDGEEVRLGLDPRINETEPGQHFTTTTVDEASGVEIVATGPGVVADYIHIRHEGSTSEADFLVGPTVRVTNTTAFAQAEVRMPLAEDVNLRDDEVAIYRWDPHGDEGWVQLETTFDREHHQAVATVSSFSYLAVFDVEAWEQTRYAFATPGWPALEPFDDLSGWATQGNVSHTGRTVLVESDRVADRPPVYFAVENFSAPEIAYDGQLISVSAEIVNEGTDPGVQTVEYIFGGTLFESEEVALEPGESTEVEFWQTIGDDHEVTPWRTTYVHGIHTEDDAHEAEIEIRSRDDDDDDDDDDESPEPASFRVSEFSGTDWVRAGGTVSASATVTNTGGMSGSVTVTYSFDGDAQESEEHWLRAGESTRVSFSYQTDLAAEEGYYSQEIEADGSSASGLVWIEVGEVITPMWPVVGVGGMVSGVGSIELASLAGSPGGVSAGSAGASPSATSPVAGGYGAAVLAGQTEAWLASDEPEDGLNETVTRSSVSRPISFDRGVDSIYVQVRVRGTTNESGDSAEVVLQSDQRSLTLFSLADGADAGWEIASSDAWAFAGEDAEVVIRTEGNASVEVDYVSLMVDSTGSDIPDAVEAMDLRMPVGPPGVVGTPLDLDPTRADTSGDGLLDHEQVEVDWQLRRSGFTWEVWAQVLDAEAHPARIDTTGDGLRDHQQLEGWEIYVTESPKQTKAFFEGLDALDIDESADVQSVALDDLAEAFTERPVGANPLVNDTSGDGLSDAAEYLLGTDPEQADTTGDGIPDWVAYEDPEQDPTLFRLTGPAIDVWGVSVSKPRNSYTYTYEFSYAVSDPSGIENLTIRKDDAVEQHHVFPRYPVDENGTATIQTTGWNSVSDAFLGTRITLEAADRFENVNGVEVYQRGTFYSVLGEELEADGFASEALIETLGVFSGLVYGFGEVTAFFALVLESPLEVYEAIKLLAAEIGSDPVFLATVIASLPGHVEEIQQADNPHPPGSTEYEVFRQGWYIGYVTFQALTLVFSASQVKNVASIQRLAEMAATTTQRLDRVKQVISATGRVNLARQSNYRLGQSVRLTLGKGAEQVLGPVRTAGQQARVANQLGASETMRVLWETYPTQLSLYMVRSGVSVTLLVDRMHSEAALALFEEDGEEEGPVLLPDGGFSIEQRYQDTIALAIADETVSDEAVEATIMRVDRLEEPREEQAKRFVVETGVRGVVAVSEVSDEEMDRLLEITYDGAIAGDDRFVDETLSPQDTIALATEGTISETLLVVKDQDGMVSWLEEGNTDYGKIHIERRHIHGNLSLGESKITSFFPLGQTVTPQGLEDKKKELPETMGTGEWKLLIYDAINKGEKTPRVVKTEYMLRPNQNGYPHTDITQMRVIVFGNGIIETSYPEEGEAVKKWNPDIKEWIE